MIKLKDLLNENPEMIYNPISSKDNNEVEKLKSINPDWRTTTKNPSRINLNTKIEIGRNIFNLAKNNQWDEIAELYKEYFRLNPTNRLQSSSNLGRQAIVAAANAIKVNEGYTMGISEGSLANMCLNDYFQNHFKDHSYEKAIKYKKLKPQKGNEYLHQFPYYSFKDVLADKDGNSGYVDEHLIPADVWMSVINNMGNRITGEDIKKIFEIMELTTIITDDENTRLNAQYKSTIPNQNNFITNFPNVDFIKYGLERYDAVNVKLIINPGLDQNKPEKIEYYPGSQNGEGDLKIIYNGNEFVFNVTRDWLNKYFKHKNNQNEIARMQELAGIREFDEFNADDFEDLDDSTKDMRDLGYEDFNADDFEDLDSLTGDMRDLGFDGVKPKDSVMISTTSYWLYEDPYVGAETVYQLIEQAIVTAQQISDMAEDLGEDGWEFNDLTTSKKDFINYLNNDLSPSTLYEIATNGDSYREFINVYDKDGTGESPYFDSVEDLTKNTDRIEQDWEVDVRLL